MQLRDDAVALQDLMTRTRTAGRRFSWERIVEQHVALYGRVLGTTTAGAPTSEVANAL
jgi:hypothetical protein